jgi:hypothetical protein
MKPKHLVTIAVLCLSIGLPLHMAPAQKHLEAF